MKNNNSADVTVVIPTYNEEPGIGPTIKELQEVLEDPCYLVVDGNSTDRTVEIAKELGASVLTQNGKKGKGQAIGQVLSHINPTTRYVVIIDADYTYPSKNVLEMIQILEKNPRLGMVTGNRFSKPFELRQAMNDIFYLGNRLLALAQHVLNGVRMRDPLTGFRVIRWEILEHWKPKSKGFDIEVELNKHVIKKGYGIQEIPISYRKRVGKKKLRIRHGWRIFRRILSLIHG